jgi:hypothetical protein
VGAWGGGGGGGGGRIKVVLGFTIVQQLVRCWQVIENRTQMQLEQVTTQHVHALTC